MLDLSDTFIFNGQRLPYNRIEHNNFPCSERAVEIPVACNFLARLKDKSRLLEVGNVIKAYEALIQQDRAEILARRIIDKYEVASGVENVDLMDLAPSEKYSAIVSISTVEHIGQGAEPNQTLSGIEMTLNNCGWGSFTKAGKHLKPYQGLKHLTFLGIFCMIMPENT